MATFCLPKNYLFDNSNFARAHIAHLAAQLGNKLEDGYTIRIS